MPCIWDSALQPSAQVQHTARRTVPKLQFLSVLTPSSSALARLDFSGLSGDSCSSLRFLAQVNALRSAAAAGNEDAAARCAALGRLAAGLPAAAEAGALYRRLAAATQHAGGPCALPYPVIPVAGKGRASRGVNHGGVAAGLPHAWHHI